ncbi:hypothetical protein JYG23_02235 [Sedimentibacter sp. zth1]|uniref:hypothetical protein n=1 Tax=Sedimentibacter sp. zth1 TaxID=2816908 RepID=UPI001A9313AC|nr:hypothetical protein [Sedimentibacter sp. zth1]QSX06300.1 hypothetical protein JYG23_02235 [Sedimentibacter sp. zth1]
MDTVLFEKINQYLCDLTIAQRNMSILHWNLLSNNFIPYHEYYGMLYETLADYIDISAEQIRFQQAFPKASISDAVKCAKITSIDSTKPYYFTQSVEFAISMIEYLKYLADDIMAYSDEIGQLDVTDVFTQHSTNYGKILYFLRSSME